MLSSVPARLWVLVTDGHRARIVVPEDAEGRFRTDLVLGVVEHPHCPPPLPDGSRHAPRDQFVTDVVLRLDQAVEENAYDRLLLVAPRLIADRIRHALQPAARQRIIATLDHDYVALTDAVLSDRLARWWLAPDHAAGNPDESDGGAPPA